MIVVGTAAGDDDDDDDDSDDDEGDDGNDGDDDDDGGDDKDDCYREFELRLPREEVELVDQLREQWAELLDLADQVREVLLKERRGAFEQELDKQVKVRALGVCFTTEHGV